MIAPSADKGRRVPEKDINNSNDLASAARSVMTKEGEPKPLPTKSGIYTITPEIAREWLVRNRNRANRPLKVNLLNFLMQELKEGRWKVNGQTVSFKRNGELNDGQHRLLACVLSETPLKSYVVFNVADDAFTTVDTGRPRSAADVLALAGFTHTAPLAAATRWALAYDEDRLSWTSTRAKSLAYPNELMLDYVRRNPNLQECCAILYNGGARPVKYLMPPSVGVFSYFKMRQLEAAKAESFMTSIMTGANLMPGSPILTLRETLVADRVAKLKMPPQVALGYVIKAWNAYMYGRRLVKLSWMRRERFPRFGERPAMLVELPEGESEAIEAIEAEIE